MEQVDYEDNPNMPVKLDAAQAQEFLKCPFNNEGKVNYPMPGIVTEDRWSLNHKILPPPDATYSLEPQEIPQADIAFVTTGNYSLAELTKIFLRNICGDFMFGAEAFLRSHLNRRLDPNWTANLVRFFLQVGTDVGLQPGFAVAVDDWGHARCAGQSIMLEAPVDSVTNSPAQVALVSGSHRTLAVVIAYLLADTEEQRQRIGQGWRLYVIPRSESISSLCENSE